MSENKNNETPVTPVPGYTATMEIAGAESMENVNVQPPVLGFKRPDEEE